MTTDPPVAWASISAVIRLVLQWGLCHGFLQCELRGCWRADCLLGHTGNLQSVYGLLEQPVNFIPEFVIFLHHLS